MDVGHYDQSSAQMLNLSGMCLFNKAMQGHYIILTDHSSAGSIFLLVMFVISQMPMTDDY